MNTIAKIGIGLGVVIALWTLGRITKSFEYLKVGTTANFPTLKLGESFFASRFINPDRFDFICFTRNTPEFGKQTLTYRLCGLEGDTIEIRQGILFVNRVDVDRNLGLAHNYIVSMDDFLELKEIGEIDESMAEALSADSMFLFMRDKFVKEMKINAKPALLPVDHTDEYIFEVFRQNWNQDRFGPVIVPKGKFFVLGDNRHRAQDSRYIGFVDKSTFVGTVIGHK